MYCLQNSSLNKVAEVEESDTIWASTRRADRRKLMGGGLLCSSVTSDSDHVLSSKTNAWHTLFLFNF